MAKDLSDALASGIGSAAYNLVTGQWKNFPNFLADIGRQALSSLTAELGKAVTGPAVSAIKDAVRSLFPSGGTGQAPLAETAKGALDTQKITASIDLVAAKFQLDRLAQILDRTPVVDYKTTSVDTQLHLEVDRNGGKFAGGFHLAGLNVGHPMIADKEVRDLASRAREGRLRPEELDGGTFTVSNLGMFGVDAIYAIVNPPQAGILGLGAAQPRPVAEDGSVVVATVMTCTLSADHRVLDGATGARFLGEFKKLVERPLSMML